MTAASECYAMDAFSVYADGFLIKPFVQQQVDCALNRFQNMFYQMKKNISFMVDRTMKKFCLDEIIYMETCGHATMIHTLHGDFRTNCSLTRAKEKMPDVEKRSLTRLSQEEPEISQHATVMQKKQRTSSDGLQNAESTRCVRIHGDGRQ